VIYIPHCYAVTNSRENIHIFSPYVAHCCVQSVVQVGIGVRGLAVYGVWLLAVYGNGANVIIKQVIDID